MSLIVAYNSHYGSTQQYAEEFALRHGVVAEPLSDAVPGETMVVFSPNYAGTCEGVKWLQHQDLSGAKVALAVVGMTLTEEVRTKDPMADALGEKATQVTRFYLPGRLAYSSLTRVHKAAMWGLHKMLQAKKHRSPNEEAMLQDYNTDVDRVDFSELDAIDQWLEG